MATTPNTPNPQQMPPYLFKRQRSIAGPILLIILGIIFTAINAGWVTKRAAFEWFANYWPALIIIWGVIKLLEYMKARSSGEYYRGIGVGGVFLLIFLILFGSAMTGAWRIINARGPKIFEGMKIDGQDMCSYFGKRYDFARNFDRDFPSGTSMRVIAERGDIK